jgi:hypothetical protein
MKKYLWILLLVGVAAAQQIDPSQIKAGNFNSKMGFNAGLCDLKGAPDLKQCFGAVGDGSTNDATIINSALVTMAVNGGVITVPEANFVINADKLLLQSNVRFRGRGPNSKFSFTGTAPTFTCGTAPSDTLIVCSAGKTNTGFENMKLDYSASTAHTAIMQDDASSNFVSKDVFYKGQATDTSAGPSGYVWLFGNGTQLSGNAFDTIQAVLIQGASDCSVHDNYFYNYRTGVYLKGVTSPSARNCLVTQNHYISVGGTASLAAVGFDAVLVEFSKGFTIDDEIISVNREHGIYVSPYSTDFIISNNNVAGCLVNGCIQIRGNQGGSGPLNDNVTLTGNSVKGAQLFATATATLSGTSVASIAVTRQGAGYSSPPAVSFSTAGGPGSGATATANIDGSGHVTSITVTAGGTGYLAPPIVSVQGLEIGYLLQGIRGLKADGNSAVGVGAHGFYANNIIGGTFTANYSADNQGDGFALLDDVGPNKGVIFSGGNIAQANNQSSGTYAGFHVGLNNGYASSNIQFLGNISADRETVPKQAYGFKFDGTTNGSSIADLTVDGNSGVGNTVALYSTTTAPTGYTNLFVEDVLNGVRTIYSPGGLKVAPIQNTLATFTTTFGNASTTAGTYGTTINMGSADPTTIGLNVQFAGGSNFRVFGDRIAVSGTGVSTFAGPLTIAGALTLSNVSGSTQCLHVNSSGLVTGSGADCGIGSGGGLADPGGNGIIKRTALNVTAPAVSTDVTALWTGTCNSSSFLRGDGQCLAPAGSGNTTSTLTTGYIPKASGANSIVNSSIDDGVTTPNTVTSTASNGIAALKVSATQVNGGGDWTEGTCANVTAAAGHDVVCPDSTLHYLKLSNNNGSYSKITTSGVDINTADQVTATHLVAALPSAQGGLNANAGAFTGVLRMASGTASASELSGDVTTSGSNVVNVSKINGSSITTNAAADQTIVSTAAATLAYATIPDCHDATHGVAYTQSTHSWSCQAITGSAGGVTDPGGNGIMTRTALNTTAQATAHDEALIRTCADTSGSGTAQVCTTSPSFTPAAKDCIIYTTTTANTGTGLTLNVNSLGAKSVAKWQGSTTLAAGDVPVSKPVNACYDGTNWNLATIGNAPSGGGGSITVNGSGSATNLSDSTPAAPIASKPGSLNVNFQISGANASGYVDGVVQRYMDRRIGIWTETGTAYNFVGSENQQEVAQTPSHVAPQSGTPFPYIQSTTTTTINTPAGIRGSPAYQRGGSWTPHESVLGFSCGADGQRIRLTASLHGPDQRDDLYDLQQRYPNSARSVLPLLDGYRQQLVLRDLGRFDGERARLYGQRNHGCELP